MEVGNQIVAFPMVCNLHIQPPFFVLNCLQIRIKELSPSPFTTTSASFHSPQMSQPHMLYFCRCTFPLKYSVLRKCLHLQFTTYHICCLSNSRVLLYRAWAFESVSNQGESLGKANLVLKKNLLGTLDVRQVRKAESRTLNYIQKKWFEDGDFRKPRKLYVDFYRCTHPILF